MLPITVIATDNNSNILSSMMVLRTPTERARPSTGRTRRQRAI